MNKLNSKLYFGLLTAPFALAGITNNADAACSTSCSTLGYVMDASKCEAGTILKCPFDNTKVYCKEKTCEDMGKKTCNNACIEASQCCTSKDCGSGYSCVNNSCSNNCPGYTLPSCPTKCVSFAPSYFYDTNHAQSNEKDPKYIAYHNQIKDITAGGWGCINCNFCGGKYAISCPKAEEYSVFADVLHKTYVLAQRHSVGMVGNINYAFTAAICIKKAQEYEGMLANGNCWQNSWTYAPDRTYLGSTGTYNYNKICSMD